MLLKALVSDTISFFTALASYFYWNYKGVRITFSCQVSLKAKLERKVLFTGNSVITENSKIGAFTYGHNVNINNMSVGKDK